MNISNLSLQNPWIGALIVVAVVIISVVIQLISNRWFNNDDFEKMQNVGGIYMSAVGTLYSVVLGMILANASEDFSDAKKCIEKESEGLLKVHAYSLQLPERYRREVAVSIKEYIDHIINYDSINIPDKETRRASRPLFLKIRSAVAKIEPETNKQNIIYQQLLEEFDKAGEGRRERFAFSSNNLTWVEWLCLITGGVITIVFSFLFYVKNKFMHALMTGMVSLMVSLDLYAVYMLTEPFTSSMRIPTQILHDLRIFIDETEKTMNPSQQTEPDTIHPPLPAPPHHSSPSSSRS
jgi:hypothetical protein